MSLHFNQLFDFSSPLTHVLYLFYLRKRSTVIPKTVCQSETNGRYLFTFKFVKIKLNISNSEMRFDILQLETINSGN